MIQNINDEKKNLRLHQDSNFSDYLSEEELDRLIRQVESQEMLHAPIHLKDNVMAQIRSEKRSIKSRQIFVYRVKVLAAMAAALMLVILMPDDHMEKLTGIAVLQTQNESLEQMAIRRQENVEANWEKYIKERQNGGVRGFLNGINDKVTEFGTSLYNSIGAE